MIRNLVDLNCRAIFNYPRTYLIILLLLTGIASFFYATLKTETSVESLIIEKDPDLQFYEKFKKQFGEDEFLVVGISAPDVFESTVLEFIRQQTGKLEEIEEIKEVSSLTNVDDFIGSESDFIVQPLVQSIPQNNSGRDELRQRALRNSLIKDSLLNLQSTATLFFIRPEGQSEDPGYDERLVRRVETLFSQTDQPWPGFQYHIAGWLVTDVNLSRSMQRDMMTFMPLTYLLLIILVSIALRNRWAVILAIINVSICLIWTLALLNLSGGAMSPITSILPPLIMALAVSDSIHIFVEFLKQDRRREPIPSIIRKTVRTLAIPCFLTSFTTAIGFASLCISQVPPISHFGIAAAGGMLLEFLFSMTIIPLGLYFLRNKISLKQAPVTETSPIRFRLQKFAGLLPALHKPVLWGTTILLLVSLLAATNIRVETNLLEYFKKSSFVYQDSQFIDRQLGGVETIEVSLLANQPDQLLEPEALALIEQIENYLLKQPIVSEVNSIDDFFREMNKAFHNEDEQHFTLPASRAMAAQYLLLYEGDEIDNFIDSQRQWTRISARITEHNSSVVAGHIENLDKYLEELTGGTQFEARITGKTLIANKLISFIVNSQVQSLSLAFVLVFIVMFSIFKSWKLGLISIIPNILPILLNFAIMGIFDIPLNSATAIIAAVAIGIAVDDTIHFICQYQMQRTNGETVVGAIQDSIVEKGVPILVTSLIMTGGFGILLFGSFVPTIQFGLLSALIMLFAVISDLVVLPALLLSADS